MSFDGVTRTQLEADRNDLASKLSRIDADLEAIKSEMAARMSGLQKDAQTLRSSLGQVSAEIARREAQDAIVPTISDHALLRYVERVFGVNVEAMKAELLTETVSLAIKSGATAVRSPAGTMVIKGSTVVTFLDPEMRPKRKTKRGLVDAGATEDFDGEAA